jgi:hypothetical protein
MVYLDCPDGCCPLRQDIIAESDSILAPLENEAI